MLHFFVLCFSHRSKKAKKPSVEQKFEPHTVQNVWGKSGIEMRYIKSRHLKYHLEHNDKETVQNKIKSVCSWGKKYYL